MLGSTLANSRRRRLLYLNEGRAASDDAASASRPCESVEDFFEMCGGRPPLGFVVDDNQTRQRNWLEIDRPFAIIGRHEQCDLRLPDSDVSPRHAYVQLVRGRVFCCDLASRRGTYWNGQRMKNGWLCESGSLRIGPYTLRLSGAEQAAATADADLPLPTARDSGDPLDQCVHPLFLEFLNNQTADRYWQVNRDMTFIGRDRSCKLRLADETISSVHAALVRTPAGLWMIDLLGRGGTFLDGRRVRFAAVEDGQELRIGKFRIGIHFEEPSAIIVRPAPERAGEKTAAASFLPPAPGTSLAKFAPAALPPETFPPRARPPEIARLQELLAAECQERHVSNQFVLSVIEQFAGWHEQSQHQTQQAMQSMMTMLEEMRQNQQKLTEHIMKQPPAADDVE